MQTTRIGVFAPASPVGPVELELGLDRLRSAGLDVSVHPQTLARHFIYAGTHTQRAHALWDLAHDASIDALWAARGGYGCTRLLPILDELTEKHGPPPTPKLLVGYSDLTALHQYVRTRWHWRTLHANMPASASFVTMPDAMFEPTLALVRAPTPDQLWPGTTLENLGSPITQPITGPILGGNLTTWAFLAGTPYYPSAEQLRGAMLFFEDLDEGFHKLDGLLTQLHQAGGMRGVAALLIGGFHDCHDSKSTMLTRRPTTDDPNPPRVPLREPIHERQAVEHIFGEYGQRHGLPVLFKLPVSHGPDYHPLPLGTPCQLTPQLQLKPL